MKVLGVSVPEGHWQTRFLLLMSIVSLSGCFGSSGTSAYEEYQRGRTAFTELVTDLGGTATDKTFEVADIKGNAWILDLSGAQFTPAQADELIEGLKSAGYIAEVNFSGSSLTDEQLIKFDENELSMAVMNLNLSNTAITDAAIDKLQKFYCISQVNLSGTKVTKAAVDRWLERRRQDPDTPKLFLNPKITM